MMSIWGLQGVRASRLVSELRRESWRVVMGGRHCEALCAEAIQWLGACKSAGEAGLWTNEQWFRFEGCGGVWASGLISEFYGGVWGFRGIRG
jgi:hypothetical protein